jgi:hypothetical protein
MTENNPYIDKPWYKNPMVWMVIFFPSVAVVAGISTIFIAINTADGLVVDDYYKQGLQINQVIEHDKKARQLGLSALVNANAKSGEIRVSMSSKVNFDFPSDITFKLVHRTIPGLDQTTTLSKIDGSTEYHGYIKPPIIEGRWNIQIMSDKDWRLKQNFTTRNASNILINISP